jgi:demethylmenaquinone methyltransferase/2-methoxy-6-polyprenyl-1,4-benzoquinol methylase
LSTYAESLDLSFYLREQTIRDAIQSLNLHPESQGLDVGCGIGNITALLVEAVAPNGHVTGVDISPEMVTLARKASKEAGLTNQLTYRQGDMHSLPFEDAKFDWAWSVDCVGYAPIEPLPLIAELMRVVKPGGLIAILAWSSQQLLSGYPQLEARLNATSAGIAPFHEGKNPQKHFLRASGWFHQLGLMNIKARTFIGEVQAPLNANVRAALLSLMGMRWPGIQPEITPEDWQAYKSLSQPESPDFILDQPDYYAFFTYSMFSGEIPV